MVDELDASLERVRARIAEAAARAGRRPEELTLVAVTKGVPAPRVARLVELGVRDLGENRVQELIAKRVLVDDGVCWHMVGTLQRNKVAAVVGSVVLVHSVEGPSLAGLIGARARALGVVQDVLLEVNTSGEATKHGVEPGEAMRAAEAVAAVEGVRLKGLMTIAAPGDRDGARRAFAALRGLRDAVAGLIEGAGQLSMGMSEDLEEGVEEGATIVRVGTALFGPRSTGAGPAGARGRPR